MAFAVFGGTDSEFFLESTGEMIAVIKTGGNSYFFYGSITEMKQHTGFIEMPFPGVCLWRNSDFPGEELEKAIPAHADNLT